MWSIDTKDVEQGFLNPPVGRNRYKITEMKMELNKKDPKGKMQYVSMKIKDKKATYSVAFWVMSEDATQAKIAQNNVGKIAIAAGLTGAIKPERLKSFVNKDVDLEFKASKDGKYINFQSAYAAEAEAEAEEEEEEPEEETESEEETEEQEEEAPKPAGKKAMPWKK